MWTRSELKNKAKVAFKANYWRCVAVSVALGLITTVRSIGGSNKAVRDEMTAMLKDLSFGQIMAVFAILGSIVSFTIVISIVINIFIENPLNVACHKFYIKNAEGAEGFNSFGEVFKSNSFANIFVVMFMASLIEALFTLLLIIPGIIKSYEYRMVPYILAENTNMKWKDVLASSKAMMEGQKMNAFVLDLSFIGWEILNLLTLGVLGIFYVQPYIDATNAELYRALKK